MLSISNKPTCFLNDGLRTPSCVQDSPDKSNLSNIFELIITSNITFLESFSFSRQLKAHRKTKNRDVLSVSVQF